VNGPALAGSGGRERDFALLAALAYAAVAAVLLARIAIGRASVRRLAARAVPVTDPEWTGMVRDLAWMLEIDRPVALLRGGSATMPMTWGILHPVILLPAEARTWTTERLRVVLLHELAHVARHDCLTQTLAAIACALYWFHPASWHAARRLRVERELACDDRVLGAGTRAREYAAHLLEVARGFSVPRAASVAAIGMARPSQLEGRLLAVLDAVRDRRAVSPRVAAGWVAAAALLVLPLAALRPGDAAAQAPPPAEIAPPAPATQPARVPARPVSRIGSGCELRRGTSFECQVRARSGERLTLELGDRVSVRVVGRDHDGVEVYSQTDGRRLDITAQRVAGGVRVTARGAHGVRDGNDPDVVIEVPGRFDVQVSGDGSGLELRDVRGTFTGTTRGGGLAFVRAAGTVRMDAAGGGAYVRDSYLDGEVKLGGGAVMVDRLRGGLRFTGAAVTARGSSDVTASWADRGRASAGSSRPASAGNGWSSSEWNARTWSAADARGAGVTTATVNGVPVTCFSDRCTVTVDSGRAAVVAEVRSSGMGSTSVTTTTSRSATRATTTATATGRDVRAAAGDAGPRRGSAATATGRRAAVSGDDARGRGWSDATDRPAIVVGADDGGYAYATGDAAGRIESIRAMARYAPADAAAQGIARLALEDADARVQRAAIDALAGLRGAERDRQLRRIARQHRDTEIRHRAAAAMR